MPGTTIDFTDEMTETQKVITNLLSINTAVNTLQEQVGRHHKILLEGNGQIPLVEQVRNHSMFIDSTKFWLRTVAVAIVLQTITFGSAAIIYFVKLYPLLSNLSQQQP